MYSLTKALHSSSFVFPKLFTICTSVEFFTGTIPHPYASNILMYCRDVKPENVVLDEFGNPYLTDFGISDIVDPEDRLCFLSSGTRQYLAPEVFTRQHAHGVESDFWSLGVMAYEMFFQRRPFEKHCPLEFVEFAESVHQKGIFGTSQFYRASVESGTYWDQLESANDKPEVPLSTSDPKKKQMWVDCEVDPFFGNPSEGVVRDASGLVCDESFYRFHSVQKLPQHLRVPLPSFSRVYGELSTTCATLLDGLLDVRCWKRLGCGVNYTKLRTHKWFEEMNLSWHLIEMKKIAPPFVPDILQVSSDLSLKYLNRDSTTSPVELSSELNMIANEKLSGFYFVADKYDIKAEDRGGVPESTSSDSTFSKSNHLLITTISTNTTSNTASSALMSPCRPAIIIE